MLSNNNLRTWVSVKEQTVTALIAAAKKAIPCADIVELKLGTLELGEIQRKADNDNCKNENPPLPITDSHFT